MIGALIALSPTTVTAQENQTHLTLLGVPSATVAPHGTAFVALSYSNKRVNATPDSDDGSLSFGIGFGDMNNGIGGHVTTHVTSLEDSPGDSGYFGLSLAGRIPTAANPTYIGVTFDQLGGWGDSDILDPAASVAVTTFLEAGAANGRRMPLMMTLGAGTHVRDAREDPGAFAGIGVGISESFSASAAYYGDHATIGASYMPRKMRDLTINASLVDAFDQQGDQRVVVTATWVFSNLFGG